MEKLINSLVCVIYLNRCENIDCSNCKFILNLRYLYIENLTDWKNDVDKIQKFCRFNYGDFFFMRTFVHFLADIERKRIDLDKKFKEILKIWNATHAKKWAWNNLTKKYASLKILLIFFFFNEYTFTNYLKWVVLLLLWGHW